jgi:hypothetical protein
MDAPNPFLPAIYSSTAVLLLALAFAVTCSRAVAVCGLSR